MGKKQSFVLMFTIMVFAELSWAFTTPEVRNLMAKQRYPWNTLIPDFRKRGDGGLAEGRVEEPKDAVFPSKGDPRE